MKMTRKKGMALAVCSLPFFVSGLIGCQSNTDSREAPESGSAAEIKDAMENAKALDLQSPKLPSITATEPAAVPSAEDMAKFQAGNPDQADAIPNPVPPEAQADGLSKTSAFSCTIAFNTRSSLAALPDHASWSFAPYYMENCGNSTYGQVFPTVVGHFHLMYENPNYAPIGNSVLGIYLGTPGQGPAPACAWTYPPVHTTALDAANYGRFLMAHDPSEWVKINLMSSNGIRKVFDLKSLNIRPIPNAACNPGEGKIQLWIKKYSTQQWYYWSTLLPGYIWSPFPADGSDLDEIQITTPAGSAHWQIDDISVSVH